MAGKKKPKGQYFVPEWISPISEEEKEDLLVHLIRCPGFFNEALSRLHPSLLKDEDDSFRLMVDACRRLAEKSGHNPSHEKFKKLLKAQIGKIAEEPAHEGTLVEPAQEMTGKGGLIDEAFAVEPAELSEEHARSLLKKYLYLATIAYPLKELYDDCDRVKQLPKNLPEVLEQLLDRARKLEGIDAKAVKTLGEEWKEHEARLQHYRGRSLIGLKTGIKELDKRTLGLRGLVILGAKPGAGKSTLGDIQVAVGVCRHHADNECVVVVVSLDMDRFTLYRRLHSHLGDIEWVPLMFGSPEESRSGSSMFSEEHLACLKEAKKRLKEDEVGLRMTVLDREILGDDITAQRLMALLQAQKSKVKAKRALLIVDYLQLLPVPDDVAASGDLAADKYRVRMVQKVIENTQTADNPLGDTALVISEARKPPTQKDVWGGGMSELMGSARLGYAGDAVLLYREMTTKEIQHYYGIKDKDGAEKRRAALNEEGVAPVILILEKGRDGMLRGKWGVEFHYRKSTFREIESGKKGFTVYQPPPPNDPDEPPDGAGETSTSAKVSISGAGGQLPLPPRGRGSNGKTKGKSKATKESVKEKGKGAAKAPAAGKAKPPSGKGSAGRKANKKAKQ